MSLNFPKTANKAAGVAVLIAAFCCSATAAQQLFATGRAQSLPRTFNTANQHIRYKLVNIGTFGGPSSYLTVLNFNSVPTINSFGAVVGASATSVSTTSISNGFVCGGIDGIVPNVYHAFKWQGGVVTDLGALPVVQNNCSIADAINNHDQVVGISEINDKIDPFFKNKQLRAVLWQGGQMFNLGTLAGGNESLVFGINDSGQAAGTAVNTVTDPFSLIYFGLGGLKNGTQTRAVLWQDGKIRDLGTLGGPDADGGLVNQRGQIAGKSYTSFTPNRSSGIPTLDPYLWENGRMRDLGNLGGVYGFPNALNNRGEVIGGSSVAAEPAACLFGDAQNCHAFLWNGERLIDLSTSTTGGRPIVANAINDAGTVVGAGAFPNAPFDAYAWRNGVATDLGHLDDCGSFAHAINSRGQVVGYTISCVDGSGVNAFLWENGTMVDLNTMIPAGSHLHLIGADAINDRGEIAGGAVPDGVAPRDFNKFGRAFVLVPTGDESRVTQNILRKVEHKLTPGEFAAMRIRSSNLHRGFWHQSRQ